MRVFGYCQKINFFWLQYALWHQLEFMNASPIWSENELKEVKANKYPFVVSISYKDLGYTAEKNHKCGGSLIAPNLVLTAAQCLENEIPAKLVVIAGSVDLRAGKQYDIDSWVTYDDWIKKNNMRPNFEKNDIAILKLKDKVDPSIQLGVISKGPSSKYRGIKAKAVGWGSMRENMWPRYLVEVYLDVLSHDQAEKEIDIAFNNIKLEKNLFFSRANPRAVLTAGDSGNPLMEKLFNNRFKIIGVDLENCISTVHEGEVILLNVHLSVDSYRDFIQEMIATLASP